MNQRLQDFQAHRARLYGIAYRMLGVRADAEDILQETWLRWQDADTAALRSAEAWLVTVATRLCIDRLRSAKIEREAYTGPWLPEPLVALDADSPEALVERASDVSFAFLTLLERLGPEERAAFLLHDVFDHDYPDIADMLGKTQAACRQLVHRARERVRSKQARFTVDRQSHLQLLERFVAAARSGDRAELAALFTPDATLTGDGGGKAISVLKVLHGAERIARLYHVAARSMGARFSYRLAEINGEPGLLRYLDGQLDATMSIAVENGRIAALYTVRNPDKLRGIA